MDNNYIKEAKANSEQKDIPQITLDRYTSEDIDSKNAPFLFLLQIATNERNIKKSNNNKFDNLSGKNISLYSNQEEKTHENFFSQDIDVYLREIIDKNDHKFLSGEANLFEFLLAKHFNIHKEQISQQESISFKIDLQLDDYNFLNEFGIKMPCLVKLSLENSVLKSISNIGTSFRNLKSLNVSNCKIEEIEGKISN